MLKEPFELILGAAVYGVFVLEQSVIIPQVNIMMPGSLSIVIDLYFSRNLLLIDSNMHYPLSFLELKHADTIL